MIAVDQDPGALERLRARLLELGLGDSFDLVHGNLLTVRTSGDVVLFEFCLHEMPDPARALVRSQRDAEAFQRFDDFAQLEARLAQQGATSLARIASLRGERPITIPMPYRLALLVDSFS